MAITWWSTGTASVVAGSAVVTGDGTAWSAVGVADGDLLVVAGMCGIVASVQSDTAFTLADVWAGPTIAGHDYAVLQTSATPAGSAARISTLLATWQGSRDEQATWWAGTATGGPHGDGTYPATAPDGTVAYLACPAKVFALAGLGIAENAQKIIDAIGDQYLTVNELAQEVAARAETVETQTATATGAATIATTAKDAAVSAAGSAESARVEVVANRAVVVADAATVAANTRAVASNTTTAAQAAGTATDAAATASSAAIEAAQARDAATAARTTAVQARDTAAASASTATQAATDAVSAKAAAQTDRDAAALAAAAAEAAEALATSAATAAKNSAAQAAAIVGGSGFSVVSDGANAQITASQAGDVLTLAPGDGVIVTFDATAKRVTMSVDPAWLDRALFLRDLTA